MNFLHATGSPNPGGYRDIAPGLVAPARARVRIVDVREPAEYTGELGHVPGAELVPLAMIEGAAQGWDKEQEIVLVCRSGARSGRAAALLSSMGFCHVMNMTGGMIGWNDAGLPIER